MHLTIVIQQTIARTAHQKTAHQRAVLQTIVHLRIAHLRIVLQIVEIADSHLAAVI